MIHNLELMHSYYDFPDDAKGAFKKLSEQYKLKFSGKGIYAINLENKYCRIRFDMDRYNLNCVFFRKCGFFRQEDDFEFNIIASVYYLTNEDPAIKNIPKTSHGDRQSICNILNWYAAMIEKYLADVLTGRFNRFDELKNLQL